MAVATRNHGRNTRETENLHVSPTYNACGMDDRENTDMPILTPIMAFSRPPVALEKHSQNQYAVDNAAFGNLTSELRQCSKQHAVRNGLKRLHKATEISDNLRQCGFLLNAQAQRNN